jgi:hypothetical protein
MIATIPRNEGLDMLKLLLDRTKKGRLSWSPCEPGEYAVDFARFSFLVGKKHDNGDGYFFSVVADENPIGTMDIRNDDGSFKIVQELYDEAARNTVLRLFEEAKKTIERGSQKELPPLLFSAPPPLPALPTQDQIEQIFKNVAGKWNLDYSRGKEKVLIDSSGNYYALPNEPSKGPPNFRLAIIACNPELTEVEWAKDRLNGQRRQIEVLTITKNKLEGSAKHDQHRLVYSKI